MPEITRHISTFISRPATEVYEYAADAEHLSKWAAGLAESPLKRQNNEWVAHSPMGRITVAFCERNAFGVLDHTVTLPDGSTVLNPMRVIPIDETNCEIVFTLRQRGMTDEAFDADAHAVEADLATLKAILETQ